MASEVLRLRSDLSRKLGQLTHSNRSSTMTAESSSIDVAPHWLMRLFGAQAATFSLGDKGLEVTTKSGAPHKV